MATSPHTQRLLQLVHDRTGDLFVAIEPADAAFPAARSGRPQLKPVEPVLQSPANRGGALATLRVAVVALDDRDCAATALAGAIAARAGVTADLLIESEAAESNLFAPSYGIVVVLACATTNRTYLDLFEADLRNSHPDASLFVLTSEAEGRRAFGRRARQARVAKWADAAADELLGGHKLAIDGGPGR